MSKCNIPHMHPVLTAMTVRYLDLDQSLGFEKICHLFLDYISIQQRFPPTSVGLQSLCTPRTTDGHRVPLPRTSSCRTERLKYWMRTSNFHVLARLCQNRWSAGSRGIYLSCDLGRRNGNGTVRTTTRV
jgi:hypothetical protein